MADSKPADSTSKIVVSLKAGGVFFAIANVICVAMIVWGYMTLKTEPKTISVTGSHKKVIVSDLVTWSGTFSTKDPSLTNAYDSLKAAADKVKAYLVAQGIKEPEITFSAITTNRRFHQDVIPAVAPPAGGSMTGFSGQPTIITTDKVEMYTLVQTVSVSSGDMVKVPEISRNITSLIKDGVEIDSSAPSYIYTKLGELKIDMLAEATKDATNRATQIVTNANGKLGKLVEAKMGVIQINAKNTSGATADGNNDLTSLEKEITAIVTARFIVD